MNKVLQSKQTFKDLDSQPANYRMLSNIKIKTKKGGLCYDSESNKV